MCGSERSHGFGLKLVSTFAGLVSLTAVFAAAVPREAVAHPVPNVRHLFRQAVIPTGESGQVRIGLWILNPSSGRLRLCLLDDPAANDQNFLKCSKWLGGSATPGRYGLMDIRRRLPHRFRRIPGVMRSTGVSGVWILDYQTGATQACVIANIEDPTGSLACAAAP